MLKPANRLAKVRDFNLVVDHGRWLQGPNFGLKFIELAKNRNYFPAKIDPNEFEKQLKIAFSVGLKVSKSAVKRNRLRRQMREVARLLIKDNKLKNGYYIMYLARVSALTKNYAEIREEMELLLRRAGIL